MPDLCRYFDSTFAGAPAISGTAGTLTTASDSWFGGFNSGSCTISQAGGVATLNRTAHGFVDQQVIEVAGATESDYNSFHRVTYVDANNVTYTVPGGTASPATGSITCKTAGLGWPLLFTATNQRVFQMGAGSLGHVLQIDHTGTPQAYGAAVRMAESASAITTLTDPFPTTAQVNGTTAYSYIQVSNGNNATARAWFVQGDEKSCLIGVRTAGNNYVLSYFGETERIYGMDAFHTICAPSCYNTAGMATNSYRQPAADAAWNAAASWVLTNSAAAAFFARAGNQTTKSAIALAHPAFWLGTSNTISGISTSTIKPYGATYGIAGQSVLSDSGGLRGFFRGIYNPYEYLADAQDRDSANYGLPAGTLLRTVRVETIQGAQNGCVLVQKTGYLP